MGILSALLGDQNPVAQWASQNQNYLNTIGAGLGQGQNLSEGLGAGLANVPQAKALDFQAAEKQKADAKVEAQTSATKLWLRQHHPELADQVDAGMPISQAWTLANQQAQVQAPTDLSGTAQGRQQLAQQFGLQGPDAQMYVLTGKLPGSNQSVRAGVGQPLFGQNKTTGAIEPWQSMTDGTMVNTANPQANPADYNFDPGIASGARTTGKVDAATAGAARATLPAAEQNATLANNAIDLVTSDQSGLGEWFNQNPMLKRGLWVQGGSKMGNWQANFKQAKDQAFMQARNSLKGGGQITDYEGGKAETAISRMAAAAETGDKETFLQAAADFKDAIAVGLEKLREVAKGDYSQGGAQMPGGGGGWEVVGVE